MRGLLAVAIAVTVAVVAEVVFPGRDFYHAGWWNVALAGLTIVVVVAGRRQLRTATALRARAAIVAVVLGTVAIGLAGAASGLLAPDNRTVVGAPGQQVRLQELGGTLAFPPSAVDAPGAPAVTLERPRHAPLQIGSRGRYTGSFVLRTAPRDVVFVEVRDLRGNRLTVTQPTAAAFLSPVLLMQQRQTIAGMDLPYDSFSVPAVRRVVKAVMFTPAQAALLHHGLGLAGGAAVLFAVDDENDRPLRNALGLSAGGRPVQTGGLLLRGTVVGYPAVEVVAVPALAAVVLGALLVLGGAIALLT
ncbi:MAG: hypothetical protein WA814_11165 [Candidatus Baltobacteraceae bacterium]